VRDAWLIIPGVLAAALGGEFFVRAAVGAAIRLRIAPGIIGATVAAFATSSPELSVAVNSATAGKPEIALGDALGSNVVNVGVVLAVGALLGGISARRQDLRRDVPAALLAPVLLLLLVVDGGLSRFDGGVLLATFAAWLAVTVRQAAKDRSDVPEVLGEQSTWRMVLAGVAGLALLVLAGRLIVLSAKDFGGILGWDVFVVGAVLVAIATSVPELATVVIARLRGHDEISVGAVLGSNIFNGLLIIGVAAVLAPIAVSMSEVAIAVGAGILTLLLAVPGRSNRLSPTRGLVLLAVYAGYVALLLAVRPQ
jgi:cation:H+ antiporter